MSSSSVECIICTKAVQVFGVYNCGHFTCHLCCLRMRKMGKAMCPVCRTQNTKIYLTTTPTLDDETTVDLGAFNQDSFMYDKEYDVFYDNDKILEAVNLLRQNFCPRRQCWPGGRQEPFLHFKDLKDHMFYDHGVVYCDVCLAQKPAFLCEQQLYAPNELDAHMKGECPLDETTFAGHPYCFFCKQSQYDVDKMVVHMRESHMLCDVCQRNGSNNRYFQGHATLYRHFEKEHHVCRHPDCDAQDMMLRVFASELELHSHFVRMHGVKSSKRVPVGAEAFGFRYGNDASNVVGTNSTNQAEAEFIKQNTIYFDFGSGNKKTLLLVKPPRAQSAGAGRSEDHFISNLAASMPNATVQRTHRTENARLWGLVRTALGSDEKLFSFREKCTMYLNGQIMASEYYREAKGAFGPKFLEVFPKLIELLPDVLKKEALLAIHNTHTSTEIGKADPPPPPPEATTTHGGKGGRNKHDPRYRKAALQAVNSKSPDGVTTVSSGSNPTVNSTSPVGGQQPKGTWGKGSSPVSGGSAGTSPVVPLPASAYLDPTNTSDFPQLESKGRPGGNKPKPKGKDNQWVKGNLAAKLRDEN